MKKSLSLSLILNICFYLQFASLSGQLLTPRQAVEQALKTNPGLAAAQSMQRMAAKSNTAGRAGFLPEMALTGNWNTASQNANLTFSNGSEVARKGAGSSALNAGVQMSQDLFAGFRARALKEKLSLDEASAGEYLRMQKLLLTEQVLNAYYALVNEKQWLKQLQQMDSFFAVKLNQTELLYLNGRATPMDLLQSRADASQQKAKTAMRAASVAEATARLNLLLSNSANAPIEPSVVEIPMDFPAPDTSDVILFKANPELHKLRNDVELAKRNRQLAEASLLPSLSAAVSVNTLNSRSDVGLLLKNKTFSSSVGVNLNYPLFSGGVLRRNVDLAKFGEMIAMLAYKKAWLQAKTEVFIAYRQWQAALEQARLQRKATEQYKEIIDIARESFNLGSVNRVELVQAQTNYETALSAYMEANFRSVQMYHSLQRLLGIE